MKLNSESQFVKILETDSLTDIALIKSALDAEEVLYFIQGENMKFIGPFDHAILFVNNEDVERTIEALRPLKLHYAWVTITK